MSTGMIVTISFFGVALALILIALGWVWINMHSKRRLAKVNPAAHRVNTKQRVPAQPPRRRVRLRPMLT